MYSVTMYRLPSTKWDGSVFNSKRAVGSQDAMRLNAEQQVSIAKGLGALRDGNLRGFEDMLWLGFGDDWKPLRRALIRNGYLRNGTANSLAMTERGEQLLEKLTRNVANAASGSIAGLSDSTLHESKQ